MAVLLVAGGASCVRATPTSCQIGDSIYPGGTLNPTDLCQSCQPALDPLAWSPIIGKWCDGGVSQSPDAGPGDAGLPHDGGEDAGLEDAGTDAGTLDAGADAGPPDAGTDGGTDAGSAEDAGDDQVLGTLATYTANTYFEVASGDLDGDGLLDLAALNYDFGMDVFFGQDGGTLSAPTHYDGTDWRGVAIADLNGDGFPDVVATNGGISVFLNQGDGTLSAPIGYTTASGAIGVAIGDVNGDSAPDLVVGESTGSELFLNDGTGTFGPPASLAAPGGEWRGIAVVDLNKDGLADVAVNGQVFNDPVPEGFTVLLTLQDGGFETTNHPGIGGGVAVLDWRRDGAPDLVAGNWDGAGLSLFRNSGDGHFGAPESYPVDTVLSIAWVASGDFNGDGVPDFVGSGWTNTHGGLFLWYGNSDGGFETPRTLRDAEAQLSGLALMGPVDNPKDLAVAAGTGSGIWILRTQ